MASPQFELNEIIAEEFEAILADRRKAIAIHHAGNIDAAGAQVEKSVRDTIKNKLPTKYYVGHGHIVDESLTRTGQIDLIIADNSGSPVLFTAENKTEYFPYESVYAVAEIKSTYSNSRGHIEKFIRSSEFLYANLKRIDTPPHQLTQDIAFDTSGAITFTSADKRPYKNNIFKFMFFVDKGDFKFEQLTELYKQTDDKLLPNILIILNKGIVVKCKIFDESGSPAMQIELFPEFIKPSASSAYRWIFFDTTKEDVNKNSTLAFLYFALNEHLRKCLLLRPKLMNYFRNINMMNFKSADIIS